MGTNAQRHLPTRQTHLFCEFVIKLVCKLQHLQSLSDFSDFLCEENFMEDISEEDLRLRFIMNNNSQIFPADATSETTIGNPDL